jgi:hypothetical protein
MKTKMLILGVMVAAISSMMVSRVQAQENPLPAVKIISTDLSDEIKVIYGYDARTPVSISFSGESGVFFHDKVKGVNLEKGFSKKYKLSPTPGNEVWMEVSSNELSVMYKMVVSKDGKWVAQLEKTTYNYPIVAMN